MRCPLLCALLLTLAVSTAPAPAQETFAPLITEHTALFVHVDFRQIELHTIKQSWTNYTGDLLARLRFDTLSRRNTLNALTKDFDRLEEYIRPAFDTITRTLGIRELALIIENEKDNDSSRLIIAVPWKNMSKEDENILEQLLGETGMDILEDIECSFVPKGDFLFFVYDGEEEDFAAWFDALQPVEGEIMTAMKNLGEGVIKIVLQMTDKWREEMLESFANDFDMPDAAKNIFIYITRKVDWAATVIPNPLMAEKQPPYLLTVKTKTAADARQIRSLLESGIDMAITAWQGSWGMVQAFDEDIPEIPMVIYEFSRGYLKTMLPVINGEILLFQQPEMEPLMELLFYAYAVPFLYAFSDAFVMNWSTPKSQCRNNLMKIGLALHVYHEAHDAFPPLYTVDAEGKPLHSWRVLLLPYLEEQRLYERIRLDEPWDSEHNKQFHSRYLSVYTCPKGEVDGDQRCHYSVIVSDGGEPITGGSFAPAERGGVMTGMGMEQFPDGLTNTLAVVEVKEGFCWMDPTADVTFEEFLKGINTEGGRVGSPHRGGAFGVMFDGRVQLIPDALSEEVLRGLGTPNGGEADLWELDWKLEADVP